MSKIIPVTLVACCLFLAPSFTAAFPTELSSRAAPQCVTAAKSVPPQGFICNQIGRASNVTVVDTITTPNANACADWCLTHQPSCVSFSYNAQTTQCITYSKKVIQSNFKKNKNTGTLWANRNCFTRTCSCPSPQIKCNGQCCTGDLQCLNGSCQCPGDTERVNTSDSCSCPGDTIRQQGDTCSCPGDLVKQSDNTCSCAGDLIKQGDDTCACPGDTVQQGNTCSCPGDLVQQDDNTCSCSGDLIQQSDNTCACPGDLVQQSDNTCACPGDLVRQADNTCSCLGDLLKQSDNTCKCRGDTVQQNDNTCKCPGDTIGSGSGTCSCPGYQIKQSDNTCKCPGDTVKQGTSDCACPGDLVKGNDYTCSCPGSLKKQADNSCKCPGNLVKQNDNTCKCPGDTIDSGSGTCSCPGYQIKQSDNTCKCPGDTVKQGKSDCGCPEGLIKGDNYTCSCPGSLLKQSDNSCACPGTTVKQSDNTCTCSATSDCAGDYESCLNGACVTSFYVRTLATDQVPAGQYLRTCQQCFASFGTLYPERAANKFTIQRSTGLTYAIINGQNEPFNSDHAGVDLLEVYTGTVDPFFQDLWVTQTCQLAYTGAFTCSYTNDDNTNTWSRWTTDPDDSDKRVILWDTSDDSGYVDAAFEGTLEPPQS